MMERIIHIEWEGPYSLNQLDTLKDSRKDHGLYQIYGHHPVYGPNVLLYIGQTYGRTFGERIDEHNFGGGSQEDRCHIGIPVCCPQRLPTLPPQNDRVPTHFHKPYSI